MILRVILFIVFALHCSAGFAEYAVQKDDFSNELVHVFSVGSTDNRAVIHVSCFPSGLEIQLATDSVIFPDTSDASKMQVYVMHKFDTAKKPHLSAWDMNLAKYNNAWYEGDVVVFFEEAIPAKTLAIKLQKSGDIFRFNFSNTKSDLYKVGKACS